jgi:HPt (histidine-containing phosphotransfer) domain-containing protein
MKVVDKIAFLDTFQYFDKSIVVEIIDIFLKEYPDRLLSIKTAIESKDFDTLKFDAHSLKGVVANFVADQPIFIARQLENKGNEKDNSGLTDLYYQLEQSIFDLVDDLKEIRNAFLD